MRSSPSTTSEARSSSATSARRTRPSTVEPRRTRTPFSRELGGRSWVFAHNGKLPGVTEDPRFTLGRFRPIGETDSEHAFCFLLDRVARAREGRDLEPDELVGVLHKPVDMLGELGELNLLMSDGVHLVAFANTKLHQVHRTCIERECSQSAVVLATTPLTDEPWRPLPAGLQVFARGSHIGAPQSPATKNARLDTHVSGP